MEKKELCTHPPVFVVVDQDKVSPEVQKKIATFLNKHRYCSLVLAVKDPRRPIDVTFPPEGPRPAGKGLGELLEALSKTGGIGIEVTRVTPDDDDSGSVQ